MKNSQSVLKEKILVVEENESMGHLLRQVLETQGYDVLVCRSPFYAFSSLIRFDPVLIIFDIHLNYDGADGLEVFELMKVYFYELLDDVPVLIVHPAMDEPMKKRDLELGVKGYMEMPPFDQKRLLEKIHEIRLRTYEGSAYSESSLRAVPENHFLVAQSLAK